MIYLLLSIISSVLIAVVIRINEGRDLDRYGVMLFNYITASACAYLFMNTDRFLYVSKQLLPIGSACGFIYVTAFLVYMRAVRRLGLAVPVTITRLSVLIPVLGSVLIFAEGMSLYQVTGFVLTVVAICLFSSKGLRDRVVKNSTVRDGTVKDSTAKKYSGLFLPLTLFFLMGSGDFSLKIFQQWYPRVYLMNFVFVVFILSSLYTLVLVLIRRVRVQRRIIVGGICLGIPNFMSAFFILKVLQEFPGAIAFPLNNIGIIILSTMIGHVFWRERLQRRAAVAVCLSILAVILLNIH